MKPSSGARVLALLLLALAVPLTGCQDPPVSSLQTAKLALETAQRSGAPQSAEASYRAAESLVRSGWLEMARQKAHLAPLRNYAVAESLLSQATFLANRASRDALARTRSLERLASQDIATLESELGSYRRSLDGALTIFHAERWYADGAMALQVARRLFTKGEYSAARQEVLRGRKSMRQLATVLAQHGQDEVPYLSVWRRWVEETVSQSRANGGAAVIVEKSEHKTYLLRAGKIVRVYGCDLGYNSARQKMYAGDGATPEGKYHVSHVLTRSRYYKALRLDYPNDEDRRRHATNRRAGVVRGSIGGLIEIHGDGGRREDWTMGCVALSNSDMDHLMQNVGIGTPVTIVRRADNWP